MNGDLECLKEIWRIINRLRGDGGCPWDQQQTPDSVKNYIIEEAHEAVAAIRCGELDEIREELGDLLFMVLFMIHLYNESGLITVDDICNGICEKMIRRHPHVFGATQVHSVKNIKDNWQKIKEEEKKGKASRNDGVPRTLPALIRAYRLLSRGALQNIVKMDRDTLRSRIADSLSKNSFNNKTHLQLFGEAIILMVQLGRLYDIKAEDAVHQVLDEVEDG